MEETSLGGLQSFGRNKFRRKAFKVMEETSLGGLQSLEETSLGERPSKFRKALQNRAMLSIALCRLLRNGI